MLVNLGACGNKHGVENEEDSKVTEVSSDVTPDVTPVEEMRDDDEICFSDFLVERCVRKTLNKGWDDIITKADAASIKSLLIDPIYNPSIGYRYTGGTSNFKFYEGYIDLADLKYLTGLEILKIDNLVDYDMVVNVDSIANCKKLKKLYMQWNPLLYNPYSGIGYGYKYWADIIGELRDLEYVDLGIYVDSHMKEIMLSKTSNKQVIFYNGYNNRYATQLLNTAIAHYPNPMKVTDAGQYGSTMKYEYNGNDIDLNDDTRQTLGQIPVIEVGSYDDLQQTINKLSDTTEDLCISLWKECAEFDCSLLSKFKKLNTLTIVKSGQYMEYGPGRYKLAELKNTDKITELPYLKVINLGACKADISFLKNLKDLRELAMYACDITGISAIGKIENLTELKLFQTSCGNIKTEFASTEGNNFKNLKYYRYYGDEENMAILEYMPNLRTLSVISDIPDLSILKCCKELENINIDSLKDKTYDIKDIASLSKLKTIAIRYGKIINASEILNMPDIVSVVLPKAINNIDSTTVNNMLIKSSSVNNKLSMFAIINGPDANYTQDDVAKFDKENIKSLYDEGIYDGLVQVRITSRYAKLEKTFEETWSEIQNK